jgi:hypothetical protein
MAVRLSALRSGCALTSGRFLVLISVRGWVDSNEHTATGMIRTSEKSNDIGNRTQDFPACSIVPQPTTLPHALVTILSNRSNLSNKFYIKQFIVRVNGFGLNCCDWQDRTTRTRTVCSNRTGPNSSDEIIFNYRNVCLLIRHEFFITL